MKTKKEVIHDQNEIKAKEKTLRNQNIIKAQKVLLEKQKRQEISYSFLLFCLAAISITTIAAVITVLLAITPNTILAPALLATAATATFLPTVGAFFAASIAIAAALALLVAVPAVIFGITSCCTTNNRTTWVHNSSPGFFDNTIHTIHADGSNHTIQTVRSTTENSHKGNNVHYHNDNTNHHHHR